MAGVLRGAFGTRLSRVSDDAAPDGRIEFEIRMHSAWSAACELARFGSAVEVIGPDDVRAELARIGSELVRAYESPASPPGPEPDRKPDREPAF
jgi:hypothetical protein